MERAHSTMRKSVGMLLAMLAFSASDAYSESEVSNSSSSLRNRHWIKEIPEHIWCGRMSDLYCSKVRGLAKYFGRFLKRFTKLFENQFLQRGIFPGLTFFVPMQQFRYGGRVSCVLASAGYRGSSTWSRNEWS